MTKLEDIIGAKLETVSESVATYVDVAEDNELLQIKIHALSFSGGCFSIENPFTISGGLTLDQLLGLEVVDAYFNESEIVLKFENKQILSVSLKEQDFVGPEAANYAPNIGEIVVFN